MANTFAVRRRQLGLKIETTFGTDAVVAAANLIEPIYDLEYSNSFENYERNVVRSTLSRIAQIPGERSATISFSTELKGSGTAGTQPAHLDVGLRICGFARTDVSSTSNTYALVSTGFESATAEIREIEDDGDALVKKVLGCCGTVEIVAEKGMPVICNFEITGKYVEPVRNAAGALSPNPGVGELPEPFLHVSFSFFGRTTLLVQSVTIDIANTMTLKNDINDATGNKGAVITDRAPGGSINPEQVNTDTFNPWSNLASATEGAMSYVLGATAGNIVTVTCPAVQILEVGDGDRDSIRTSEISFQLDADSVAGDDEIEIEFT